MNFILVCIVVGVLLPTILSFPMYEDINKDHTVIVFGFSGLRWDSMSHVKMPAFEKLKHEGVYVNAKYDPFQTESLPAFVTMVTGQFPQTHGMVSNKMKDLETGYSFELSGNDPKWWKDVKPIWIRNQESGNRSALCYWPGHHIAFNGRNSEYSCSNTAYVDPFRELTTKGEITKQVMPFEDRIKYVKHWLTLNHTERPSFIGVYFEEPLKSMMKYGIHTNATHEALALVNNITQSMMDFLKDHKLYDKINFVVTGESGATDIRNGEDIFLDDFTQYTDFDNTYDIIDNGPITTIYPNLNSAGTKEFLHLLANASADMTTYNGSNLPITFHYDKKDRTMPVILVAKEGFRINQRRNTVSPNKASMGYHGMYRSSHALLIARGPAFKEGHYFEQLRNVDVYNLLCKVLSITPDENAGEERNIKDALRKARKWYVVVIKNVVKSPTRFTVAIIAALILMFTALYLIIMSVSKVTEKCRWRRNGPRKFEVPTPNKAFCKAVVHHAEGDKIHLLEESDASDLEEDLHFHIHNDADTDRKLYK